MIINVSLWLQGKSNGFKLQQYSMLLRGLKKIWCIYQQVGMGNSLLAPCGNQQSPGMGNTCNIENRHSYAPDQCLFLTTSIDGESSIYLSSVFHYLPALTVKKIFFSLISNVNLLWCTFKPLVCFLLSEAREKWCFPSSLWQPLRY